jgi:hypothetical protein
MAVDGVPYAFSNLTTTLTELMTVALSERETAHTSTFGL